MVQTQYRPNKFRHRSYIFILGIVRPTIYKLAAIYKLET